MGKASLAAQDEFQRVRSLLLAEADERQVQLDHRMNIWQFQQQQQLADDSARAAEEQARARAALTTASSVVTVGDDGPDAEVVLEQMLVARAPLQEQLKWDRQQSNTVAAGMARLEVRACAALLCFIFLILRVTGHIWLHWGRRRYSAVQHQPAARETAGAAAV